jgi:hypothetical protein
MTKFLRAVLIAMSFPVIALCIFVVPPMGTAAAEWLPAFPFIKYTTWFALYMSGVVYLIALYKSSRLLMQIDEGNAFSTQSMKALNDIKICGFTISMLHLTVLPVFYLFAELDDAPGVIFVGLIVPVAAFVIAVFAALLKRLVTEAITRQTALT